MPGRDEHPAQTRVALLEQRRLLRQSLSIWLAGQPELMLVGAAVSTGTLSQLCEQHEVACAVIGVPGSSLSSERSVAEMTTFASRHPDLRIIAFTDNPDRYLDWATPVPTSMGTEGLLRAIISPEDAEAVIQLNEPIAPITPLGPLTPRETEVLALVGQGSTTYDISEQLGISRSTVANHKERIFTKLQANNQAHAVARAVNLGLISPLREEDPRRVG